MSIIRVLYLTATNIADSFQGRKETFVLGRLYLCMLFSINPSQRKLTTDTSIDCDTRVPVDCLLYGALEMHESPEVAIIQHGSGVMQVVHNMFENGSKSFISIPPL